jgi:hypothetical protein
MAALDNPWASRHHHRSWRRRCADPLRPPPVLRQSPLPRRHHPEMATRIMAAIIEEPPVVVWRQRKPPSTSNLVTLTVEGVTLLHSWQTTPRAKVEEPRCLVELRGFVPLTPCMPCHPHPFTRPFTALLGTTSALLNKRARRGAMLRREAACGIAADNLLTEPTASASGTDGD